MKTKIDNGGSAFPCPAVFYGDTESQHSATDYGMSLRDWLAGQALSGLLSSPGTVEFLRKVGNIQRTAETAYFLADAMIAERNKT